MFARRADVLFRAAPCFANDQCNQFAAWPTHAPSLYLSLLSVPLAILLLTILSLPKLWKSFSSHLEKRDECKVQSIVTKAVKGNQPGHSVGLRNSLESWNIKMYFKYYVGCLHSGMLHLRHWQVKWILVQYLGFCIFSICTPSKSSIIECWWRLEFNIRGKEQSFMGSHRICSCKLCIHTI